MNMCRSFLLILMLLLAVSPLYAARNEIIDIATNKSAVVELGIPAATVFIANPEIADVQVVTPTRIMVMGKKIGETTLLISDDLGHELANRTIVVSTNIAELKRAIKEIAPDDDITAKAVPNGVVLSGYADDATTLEMVRRVATRYVPVQDGDIINNVKLHANNQIQIQVRFAEVSRDVDKRFGINWETFIDAGALMFGVASGEAISAVTAGSLSRTSVGDLTNDSLGFSYSGRNGNVNGIIDALAKNGLVTILAEPTLTAMSGETASFLAGGEFPVPIPQGENISIEWKQYGVSLAFTPTILGNDRINLHVRPEVSQLSDIGSVTLDSIEIPSLTTRRAETTVELASGQSFAIAGLLNNNKTQSINKFPFLGDVPILGALFRSTRYQNSESELVIIITPYLVKPTTQEKLALPTDGYKHPTDAERLLLNRTTSHLDSVRPMSGSSRAVEIEDIEEQFIDLPPQPHAVPVIPDTPFEEKKTVAPKITLPAQTNMPTKAPPHSALRKTAKDVPAPKAATEQRIKVTPELVKTIRLPSTPIPAAPVSKEPAPFGAGGFIME
ncbi:MAG: pilus assembly protein N-terminal domain-containing protein [Bdellovibrionales bacterium]